MARFEQRDTIFVDQDVLREEYTPDELIERDEQEQEYMVALDPLVEGKSPNNIFVYGDTGVGKTVSTRIILDDLQRDQVDLAGVNVEVLWINCKEMTSYQVAVEMLNSIYDDPNDPTFSYTGYARSEIMDNLWTALDSLDAKQVLLVLDEIDSLGGDDGLLYSLMQASNDGKIREDLSIGVIGICNNLRYREDLSPRVKDRLCEENIFFPPYDSNQLRRILESRAKKAFKDNVLAEDTIPLTSAFAAGDTGSCRQALDILRKAGTIAKAEGAEMVREEHVRDANEKVEQGMIRDGIESMPQHGKLVLYALTRLTKQGKTPVRKKTIYRTYTAMATQIDSDPKTDRTIHDKLDKLSLNGYVFTKEMNKGADGGRYYVYELALETDLVEDVVANDALLGKLVDGNQTLDQFD